MSSHVEAPIGPAVMPSDKVDSKAVAVPRLAPASSFGNYPGQALSAVSQIHGNTMRALAAHAAKGGPAAERGVIEIPRARRDGTLPLSFNQEFALFGIWLLETTGKAIAPLHVSRSWTLREPVDAGVMERALNEVVRRHESLRTGFSSMQGVLSIRLLARVLTRAGEFLLRRVRIDRVVTRMPGAARRAQAPWKFFRQRIAAHASLGLEFIDLSALPPQERDAAVAATMAKLMLRRFDLNAPPLLRAALIKQTAGQHMLVLVAHHVVADLWSLDLLRREITTIYDAYAVGQPSPLPEPRLQMIDVAVWERERLRGSVLEEKMAFWQSRLFTADGPVPRLTVGDLPHEQRPATPAYLSGTRWLKIGESLDAGLRAGCAQSGVTLYMILFATFTLLLHRLTGRRHVRISVNMASRSHPGMADVVGPLAQAHDLVMTFSPDDSLADVLAHARGVILDALAHQDMPIGLLARRFGVPEKLPRHFVDALPIVMDLQPADTTAPPPDNTKASPVTPAARGRRPQRLPVGFNVRAFVLPIGTHISILYPLDRMTDEGVGALIDEWRALLETLVSHPQRLVADLPTSPK